MYKFCPILKTLVWGTESWVLSGVPGFESVVAEGPEAGRKITELYPGQFPLLIKFIDAKRDLSIQVHPDDAMAAKYHGCRGKTEMWYFMGADPGAYVYCGLKERITPEDYVRLIAGDRITEVLARHEVAPGDLFFLPPGRIHAIGGGCRLAEIQQTSDITYRIYDYNRPGLDGKPRQLHTEKAKEAIDYQVYPDYRTHYESRKDAPVELVRCPYFTTTLLDLTMPLDLSADGVFQTGGPELFSGQVCRKTNSGSACPSAGLTGEAPSFVVLIGLSGGGTVRTERDETTLQSGEAILVPASDGALSLHPGPDGLRLLTTRP